MLLQLPDELETKTNPKPNTTTEQKIHAKIMLIGNTCKREQKNTPGHNCLQKYLLKDKKTK